MEWIGISSSPERYLGKENMAFLGLRARSKPMTFSVRENSFRGVRSGIRRKTDAIINRVKAGAPTDKAGRQKDKRAAMYLLAAFGSLYHGNSSTLPKIWTSKATIGAIIRMARAIWLRDTMVQFVANEQVSHKELFKQYIETGTNKIRESGEPDFIDFSPESFDQVADIVHYLVSGDIADYEESLKTPKQKWRESLGMYWPEEEDDGQFGRIERHTNPLILSSITKESKAVSVSDDLKALVRSATYRKVGDVGWKSVCRTRARCYRLIESNSIEGVVAVRAILSRLMRNECSLGKRGRTGDVATTPLNADFEASLHGLTGSLGTFLSRQFDLAVYRSHFA
jgi:hypothetical protein